MRGDRIAFDLEWKCYICNEPLKTDEGTHISSAEWGNVQRHFCPLHAWYADNPIELCESYEYIKQKNNLQMSEKSITLCVILENMVNTLLRESGNDAVIDVLYLYKNFIKINPDEFVEDAKFSFVTSSTFI